MTTTREAIAAWGSKSEKLNEMERQYLAGNLIPIEEVTTLREKNHE